MPACGFFRAEANLSQPARDRQQPTRYGPPPERERPAMTRMRDRERLAQAARSLPSSAG